ncbi:DASH complex subunit Spc19 [Hypoxylon trugodes]|uniref:DASH complex subunit Spc19 n=1 Tax=Hypoxylon trugodes TaxID=326681 RepID=UPI0021935C9B|nr:DASH complex subunit Spc19 [Hypoxylon trugodes]KAI1392464.1 DASH complex subunit Spc19 [Hypoxylon trugodes]
METTTTSTGSASYGDCVAALRTSLSFLESSVATLGTGVADYPRLVNVLKSVRHYELIPQPTLVAAEASLRDEIGPATTLLLDRAESHVARIERRIDALKARSELQQGRLLHSSPSSPSSSPTAGKGKKKLSDLREEEKEKQRKMAIEAKIKARQKEALQYSVERLELEVLQKERELRKRLDSTSAVA